MADFEFSILSGISLSCFSFSLFWLCQSALENGSKRYRSTFEQHAHAGLRDLFVFIDPSAIWAPLMLISTCGAMLVFVVLESITLSALIFVLFIFTPGWMLRRAKKARLLAFDQQMPDACMRIASSLQSGMSLIEGIRALVLTTSSPMSQELSLVLRENRMGITLDQSLQGLQDRMPTESCRMLTAALILSMRSGGALSSLLDEVGQTISQRLMLTRKLNMMTSQGKMQAWCIGLLPLVILLVLSKIDPDVTGNMLNDELGRLFLLVLIILESMGCLLLRQILKPRM